MIFQGNTGSVYGENVTIESDVTIPEDYTLTIPAGSSLTIGPEGSLTNNGTITVTNSAVTNRNFHQQQLQFS